MVKSLWWGGVCKQLCGGGLSDHEVTPVSIGLGLGFWTALGLGLGLRGPDLELGLVNCKKKFDFPCERLI